MAIKLLCQHSVIILLVNLRPTSVLVTHIIALLQEVFNWVSKSVGSFPSFFILWVRWNNSLAIPHRFQTIHQLATQVRGFVFVFWTEFFINLLNLSTYVDLFHLPTDSKPICIFANNLLNDGTGPPQQGRSRSSRSRVLEGGLRRLAEGRRSQLRLAGITQVSALLFF